MQERRLEDCVPAPRPCSLAGADGYGAEWLWKIRPSLLTCRAVNTACSFHSQCKISTELETSKDV